MYVHIHIRQDMQHAYDWTDADVVEAFSLVNKTLKQFE